MPKHISGAYDSTALRRGSPSSSFLAESTHVARGISIHTYITTHLATSPSRQRSRACSAEEFLSLLCRELGTDVRCRALAGFISVVTLSSQYCSPLASNSSPTVSSYPSSYIPKAYAPSPSPGLPRRINFCRDFDQPFHHLDVEAPPLPGRIYVVISPSRPSSQPNPANVVHDIAGVIQVSLVGSISIEPGYLLPGLIYVATSDAARIRDGHCDLHTSLTSTHAPQKNFCCDFVIPIEVHPTNITYRYHRSIYSEQTAHSDRFMGMLRRIGTYQEPDEAAHTRPSAAGPLPRAHHPISAFFCLRAGSYFDRVPNFGKLVV
ncbi:hypothetical protein DFP72DRAFT_1093423 [Ephemerocybe angulata]|uniref:Uncharacterized protein n=1 Tax=Ephemerocybe angulata TaxID=980116 RepID=A0A8H6HEC6_9AGAR|nr:hypothetical protein DFP72DRAFT_1093423 [Tulosesus angulatus]